MLIYFTKVISKNLLIIGTATFLKTFTYYYIIVYYDSYLV